LVANQNQKFPYLSIFGGGCGGSRQKNERKFYGFVSAASPYKYYMAVWHITQWNIIYQYMPRAIYKEEHQKIVERLKKARVEAGLDQVDVAEKLGKTQSYVSKIESGQRRFDVLQLKEFAKLYKKDISYFIQ
jgi:DNA-binding XRE family transcriptional regulator